MSQQAAQKCITSPLKAKLRYGKGRDIKTFVFMKLHLNDVNNSRIAEMAMIAVHEKDLFQQGGGDNQNNGIGMPRLVDKLVLCFDTQKPINPHCAARSKLDWKMVQDSQKKPFDRSSVFLINEFLKRQDRPICIVAHHGVFMDFPTLQTEINALQMSLFATEEENLLVADTGYACQDLDSPDHHKMHITTLDAIDYSIESLYLRYLNKRIPIETFTAEQYAMCLFELVRSFSEDFINVVSVMKFSDVMPRPKESVAKNLFPVQPEVSDASSNVNGIAQHSIIQPEYDVQTFVFFDLETTGLDTAADNITELCLIAVDRNEITELDNDMIEHEFGEFPKMPRVQDKISIVIDPLSTIPEVIVKLTKIDKDSLDIRGKKPFSYDTSTFLRSFLERQAHPICLVAHNGEAFDFQMLNSHLNRVKANPTFWKEIYCADSVLGIREFRGADRSKSNKLQDVLSEVGISNTHLTQHAAEGDTTALMIVAKLFPQNLFFWLDQHKRRFK